MRLIGGALVGVGVALYLMAFNMTVSLPGTPDVANADLLNQRLFNVIAAGAVFVAGVIVLVADWLARRMRP